MPGKSPSASLKLASVSPASIRSATRVALAGNTPLTGAPRPAITGSNAGDLLVSSNGAAWSAAVMARLRLIAALVCAPSRRLSPSLTVHSMLRAALVAVDARLLLLKHTVRSSAW